MTERLEAVIVCEKHDAQTVIWRRSPDRRYGEWTRRLNGFPG